MDWLEIAKSLQQGKKTRRNCECGDGNTLVINNRGKSWTCFCFRCSFSKVVDKGERTLQELAKIKEAEDNVLRTIAIPDDATRDIPCSGRVWLHRAGISVKLWEVYDIRYSPSIERVILPVWDTTHKLIWFQARSVSRGIEPKYLNPVADKDAVVFRSRVAADTGDTVIVTEDILSAIRVGNHCFAMSILGTKCSTEQLRVLSRYKTVILWLDSDAAGRGGSKTIAKALRLVTNVKVVRTVKDPKCLSDAEIKEILCHMKTKSFYIERDDS